LKSKYLILGGLVFLASFWACKENTDELIASYKNKKLYLKDVLSEVPEGLSKEDSLNFMQFLTQSWAEKQIFLDAAENYLKSYEKNFDKELAHYKDALLTERYFEKLATNTPISVSEAEIKKFYVQNKIDLNLTEEIVKVNYVKIPKESKLIPKVKSLLFASYRAANYPALEKLFGDSIEYYLDGNSWVRFSDILNEIPINPQNRIGFLSNNKQIEIFDDKYCYLAVFLDFKSNPKEIVSTKDLEDIRKILTLQKTNRFIENKKAELYHQALENKTLRFY